MPLLRFLAWLNAFELQDEVAELGVAFQLPLAVFDVQFAVLRNGEFTHLIRRALPAGQILAVEDAFESQRLELDVLNSPLPLLSCRPM